MNHNPGSTTGTTVLVLLRDPRDPRSWAQFVARYGGAIYGLCRRRWGLQEADACDVTQDVLVKLFEKLPTFRYDPSRGRFRAWLRTLAHHAWADFMEARRRAGSGAGDDAGLDRLRTLAAPDGLAAEMERAFDRELLEEARARVRPTVSPRDWQIFVDLTDGGRSGAEVAGAHGLAVPPVFMVKSRILKRLRQVVRQLEGLPPEEAGP